MFSTQPPNSSVPVRTCQRCSKPLSPHEVYCDNCGGYNALPLTNNYNQQSYYQNNYYGSAAQTPPVPGNYNNLPQQFETPAPPSSLISNPGNYYNMPQQAYGFNQSPPMIMGELQPGSIKGFPSGFDRLPQQPPQRSKRKPWLIIGISVLVVMLLSGALLAYAFGANKNGKTSNLASTPAPSPTPSVKPLFSDAFSNNNNGWDLTSSAGKFSVQVGAGKMVLEDDNNKLLWEILPGKTFGNFMLSVDATLSMGDQNNGYGIYIRGGSTQDSQLGTYYRFEIYGDGTYAIFKGVQDSSGNTQSTKLIGYLANPSIQKKGIVNHVTIIAKGQNITLMINGQTLTTFTDTNYKSGSVALFVSNLQGSPPGAQATFSHLAIYPV